MCPWIAGVTGVYPPKGLCLTARFSQSRRKPSNQVKKYVVSIATECSLGFPVRFELWLH